MQHTVAFRNSIPYQHFMTGCVVSKLPYLDKSVQLRDVVLIGSSLDNWQTSAQLRYGRLSVRVVRQKTTQFLGHNDVLSREYIGFCQQGITDHA